jgi:hypothetical protein
MGTRMIAVDVAIAHRSPRDVAGWFDGCRVGELAPATIDGARCRPTGCVAGTDAQAAMMHAVGRMWRSLRPVRLGRYSLPICHSLNKQTCEVMVMAMYKGECFCGAVKVEVSGKPEGMGYCHCRSCRSWSGGSVNAFKLWKPDAVRVTVGAEHIGMYQKTPVSQRQYCKKCGGHLMTNHPPLGLVDVFAATLPTLKFSPGVHVNYAETVLPIRDGLPKFKDFPAQFGGSGEQVAE